MTDDERAELEVLSLSNEKHKFAIELGFDDWEPRLQYAFERGIDNQWFTLVDISFVAASPRFTRMLRVFRLTDEGVKHLKRLIERKGKTS